MHAKTGIFDNNVRPNPFDQFSMAHDLPCSSNQSNQDVESTAAYCNRLAPLCQQSFGDDQAEGPKVKYFRFLRLLRQGGDLNVTAQDSIRAPVGSPIQLVPTTAEARGPIDRMSFAMEPTAPI